jgi:hypothetical protein
LGPTRTGRRNTIVKILGGVGLAVTVTLGATGCRTGSFTSSSFINTKGMQMSDWTFMSYDKQMDVVRSEMHRWHERMTDADEQEQWQTLQSIVMSGLGTCTIDYNVAQQSYLAIVNGGLRDADGTLEMPHVEDKDPARNADCELPSASPAPAPAPAPGPSPAPAPAAPTQAPQAAPAPAPDSSSSGSSSAPSTAPATTPAAQAPAPTTPSFPVTNGNGGQPGPSGKLYAVTAATNLRSDSNTSSSVLTLVPAGTMVGVQCKATGEAINGPWGTDSYWDRVVVNGSAGYLTDEYVDTKSDETNNALIPNC